jgi:hypothetical protein
MRRISILVTILITSLVMLLSGLVASPIAIAGENESVRVSSTFSFGSPLLTDSHKAAIKKAVATSGTDVTFVVTGVAGKLPGVSDSEVKLLAKKRGQAVKAYLVKLGVSKSNVTTKVKITRLGIVPKTKIVGSVAAPVVTTVTSPTTTTPTTPVAPWVPAYAVGDTGPGGGIVYYVNSSAEGFACGPTLAATCNYLEAAPTSGTAAWTDMGYAWSGNTATEIGVTVQGTAIGTGYANTLAIVGNSNTVDKAGTIARAYRGPNALSDWFLPSQGELNQMCKWARAVAWTSDATVCTLGTLNLGTGTGLGAAGFMAGSYFSSSEWTGAGTYARVQNFDDGNQGGNFKSATLYVRPVRAFGPSCANGGPCVVGDRGPGGGIVYYVSAANFTSTGSACSTTCKYLEVAPATWQSAGVSVANDLTYVWSTDPVSTGQDITTLSTEGPVTNGPAEKFNWKIGQGFHNTSVMKATSTAKDSALAYAGNSTAGQWFIPSMNELNELCKYTRGQTTGDPTVACDNTGTLKTGIANDLGGFTTGDYWSSSEDSAAHAAGRNFYSDPDFGGPSQFIGANKTEAYCVRPVRAF